MPTSRTMSRASSTSRTRVLEQLKDDHKRVKKAYRDFQKLDGEEDAEACQVLVTRVLDELTLHATIEEELLYPAARGIVADENLVDEAEVEHESMRALIEQLRAMSPEDDKFAARFTVLCEYVLHHVKEEESEMFPQLERARLDWESLAAEIQERRQELMPEQDQDATSDDVASTSEDGSASRQQAVRRPRPQGADGADRSEPAGRAASGRG